MEEMLENSRNSMITAKGVNQYKFRKKIQQNLLETMETQDNHFWENVCTLTGEHMYFNANWPKHF